MLFFFTEDDRGLLEILPNSNDQDRGALMARQEFFSAKDREAHDASMEGNPVVTDESARVAAEQKKGATEQIISYVLSGIHAAYISAEQGKPVRYEGMTDDDRKKLERAYDNGWASVDAADVQAVITKHIPEQTWELDPPDPTATFPRYAATFVVS
jgi:hypothetical protein